MMLAFGFQDLPTLNAILNGCATIAIVMGLIQIKQRREQAHKRWMLTAVVLSAAFLISYVIYHSQGYDPKKPFEGWVRVAYLAMLLSHIVLAVAVVPLVLITVVLGLRDNRPRHRKLARWTVPIWLYVSVTGVLVYLCIYVWS